MDGPTTQAGGPPGRPPETRLVPAGGINVYERADDAEAPVAVLAAGHELAVIGRRGGWVHVYAGDGLDGWVTGTALAGVAIGASATGAEPAPAPTPAPSALGPETPRVVEKQPSSLLIGTGPVVGAVGGIVAIVGAMLPWQQTLAFRAEVTAFDIPLTFLGSWENLDDGGFSVGALLTLMAAIGTLVSLIAGGGIVRRILGFAVVLVCAVYVLQQQSFLTSSELGLGTGLNVWDVADYGVAVSFLGGLVMTFAPSR